MPREARVAGSAERRAAAQAERPDAAPGARRAVLPAAARAQAATAQARQAARGVPEEPARRSAAPGARAGAAGPAAQAVADSAAEAAGLSARPVPVRKAWAGGALRARARQEVVPAVPGGRAGRVDRRLRHAPAGRRLLDAPADRVGRAGLLRDRAGAHAGRGHDRRRLPAPGRAGRPTARRPAPPGRG